MTKIQLLELHKLSVKDKIKVVQTLWDDIANENVIDVLPIEHKRILEERINIINSGQAKFKSWEDIQKQYAQI
jgi:putative addiction module component (TIGR02574 family)